jgi:hypothetical protein
MVVLLRNFSYHLNVSRLVQWGVSMRSFAVAIFFVFVLFGIGSKAIGQSACTKCMQAVQIQVATCSGQKPPSITPKDSKNPTDAERRAAAARAEADRKCAKIASDGMTACRNSSACPK